MALPSSGQLSMSQINSEIGFSSTQANSLLQQRTFDYGVAGVNQNLPYSFSEFYGKTFTYGNSITLYYYYPWDGGAGPNNYAIWGWYSQASAITHTGLYHDWSHTCYYSGTLGNGTDLFINPEITGWAQYPMVSAGWYDVYPYQGTGAWYYLTDGTNSWTCQSAYEYDSIGDPGPTPESHTFQITNLTQISTPVTINIGTQPYANGSGEITVYAYANVGLTYVDTNIQVYFQWTGDLSSNISGYVTIYNGYNCGSNTFVGAEIGEYTSMFNILSISPASSGTQTYVNGYANTNTYSCP